jgi:hypothetical protein
MKPFARRTPPPIATSTTAASAMEMEAQIGTQKVRTSEMTKASNIARRVTGLSCSGDNALEALIMDLLVYIRKDLPNGCP